MGFFGPPDIDKLATNRDTQRLIKALAYEEAAVRAAAAAALGALGDERAVAPLIAALRDESPLVQRQAAAALGELGDGRAVAPLCDLLEGGEVDVREHAARALAAINDPRAVYPLLCVLRDAEWRLRRAVVEALGEMTDPSAAAALVAALRDSRVSDDAARALATRGDPEAVRLLIEMLEDDDADLRLLVTATLAASGDARALPALIAALEDRDVRVRGAAADALGALADAGAVRPLAAALVAADLPLRERAAVALERIGLPDDPAVRVRQALVLGEWRRAAELGEAAVTPLTAALEDADEGVRRSAFRALAEIGGVRVVDPLLRSVPGLGCLTQPERAEIDGLLVTRLEEAAAQLAAETLRLAAALGPHARRKDAPRPDDRRHDTQPAAGCELARVSQAARRELSRRGLTA